MDLMVQMKLGNFEEEYRLANSTILFGEYSYMKYANEVLANYYMFAFEDMVEQDFQKAEAYCLRAHQSCDIEWLYKHAVSYYCGEKLVEYPAYGYKPKDRRVGFEAKCQYSKKRYQEILTLGEKAYSLPSLYWLPRF